MNASDEFSLDRRDIRRAFDRAAKHYDAAAVLQWEVGERLLERLELTTVKPGRVLDVGCGTGRPTRVLTRRYPGAAIVGVDLAPNMLHEARRRPWYQTWQKGAHFVCADATALPFKEQSFDIVFASLI